MSNTENIKGWKKVLLVPAEDFNKASQWDNIFHNAVCIICSRQNCLNIDDQINSNSSCFSFQQMPRI